MEKGGVMVVSKKVKFASQPAKMSNEVKFAYAGTRRVASTINGLYRPDLHKTAMKRVSSILKSQKGKATQGKAVGGRKKLYFK